MERRRAGIPVRRVLKHLSAARVALITLVTPVTALLLGAGLNGETVSSRVWIGTGLILLGLATYEYGHRFALRPAALSQVPASSGSNSRVS